jgi:hypothetical protein
MVTYGRTPIYQFFHFFPEEVGKEKRKEERRKMADRMEQDMK